MKYWEVLLTKQRERGRDGLTLPFLIGAQNYLQVTSNRLNVRDLIYEMIAKESFVTCLRFCTGTQTLIFEIKKGQNAVYFPTLNGQPQDGLSIGIFHEEELGNDIGVLIEKLIAKFQKTINNQLFSAEPNVDKREANWIPFTQAEDVPFILECFKSL